MAIATIPYAIQIDHDGKKYDVDVPALSVPKCGNCGAISIDDKASEQIDEAFRKNAGLLIPSEIREKRKQLNLTQEQLANYIRVAKETVSRWETGGQIQQRAMDQLLRLFFDVPEVRRHLGLSDSTASVSGGSAIITSGTIFFGGEFASSQLAKSPDRAAPCYLNNSSGSVVLSGSVSGMAMIAGSIPLVMAPYTSMPDVKNSEPVVSHN